MGVKTALIHERITAPTGTTLKAKHWTTEAPLRMLMNNLDPDVAERPEDLVVYGGIGSKAARNWACYEKIVEALKDLEEDETLIIQSGKPVLSPKHTTIRRLHALAQKTAICIQHP